MDGSRFDLLAREVAGSRTRRGFLGGLAALAAGAVGVRRSAAACPAGQYAGSGGRCICKSSGRPPVNGGCPCGDGRTACASGCISLLGDPANCGFCGNACPSGVCWSGTCAKRQSDPCAAPGECLSGLCVDGVCCDAACTGQCEACNVPGTAGTCSPVPQGGAPVGNRSACAGTGTPCAGACDGETRTECAYPPFGTICAPQTCGGGAVTDARICDGAGTCLNVVPTSALCCPGETSSPSDDCHKAGVCGLWCNDTVCASPGSGPFCCEHLNLTPVPGQWRFRYDDQVFGTCPGQANGTLCSGGGTCCGEQCTGLSCDRNNCGACGNVCSGCGAGGTEPCCQSGVCGCCGAAQLSSGGWAR